MANITRRGYNTCITHLIVHKPIAVSADDRERVPIKDGKQESATEDVPITYNITAPIKQHMNSNHSKFLSISRDGKYVALSFYYSPGTIKNRKR